MVDCKKRPARTPGAGRHCASASMESPVLFTVDIHRRGGGAPRRDNTDEFGLDRVSSPFSLMRWSVRSSTRTAIRTGCVAVIGSVARARSAAIQVNAVWLSSDRAAIYEIAADTAICTAWCDCSRASVNAVGDTFPTRVQLAATLEIDMTHLSSRSVAQFEIS